jgi:hypothetical protein
VTALLVTRDVAEVIEVVRVGKNIVRMRALDGGDWSVIVTVTPQLDSFVVLIFHSFVAIVVHHTVLNAPVLFLENLSESLFFFNGPSQIVIIK